MKIFFVIITSVIVITMFVGCATVGFDNALLQPGGNEISPRLPHLKISSELVKDRNLTVSNANILKSNSYMYTIFERELEENICDMYGEAKGTIDLVIINASYDSGYNGLFVISLFGPGLFGFPAGSTKTDVEFEVRVYDSEGNRVWKKIYSDSKKGFLTMYNENANGENLIIKKYKEFI